MAMPTSGNSSGKTNLMLIFDASGSMRGHIDGKAKITIAKEAMGMIVKDLPADINIGLVAYGHRRKGDCDDVETLTPLGPLDAEAFLSKVDSLNPKGKTPYGAVHPQDRRCHQTPGGRNYYSARIRR